MPQNSVYISELSTSKHVFSTYHFCRGNNSKRKTRIGVIQKGSGTYIYFNKRLSVSEGDVVFIPENIYCYSEWHGTPEIKVMYVSCFLHGYTCTYEPQVIACNGKTKSTIVKISELLSLGQEEELEAYSLFFIVLKDILPCMKKTEFTLDRRVRSAVEYITEHWDTDFSICELAKACCVSESTLYHLFKKELGQTPIHLLQSIRINIAMEYLETTDYSISTISRKVCFPSENHFRKVFRDFTGTTPLSFRKNS